MHSPFPYSVFPAALQLLLLLMPVMLATRMAIKPRPAALDEATGVLRFSLGHAKWVLLTLPLMHLSQMIWHSDSQCWSPVVAWVGLLAGVMTFYFGVTGTADLLAGCQFMLRSKTMDRTAKTALLNRFIDRSTPGLLLRVIPAALLTLVLATGVDRLAPYLHSLISTRTKMAVTVFQEARVLSDIHVVTMIAALACLIGLPRSDVFLRQPQRWKAVICLCLLGLSIAMLWTREVPKP